MNKEKISMEINQTLEILNVTEKILVNGFSLPKEQIMQTLGKNILDIFPNVVSFFESEVLAEKEQKIELWSNQLDRTISALEGQDQFFLLDVLIYELRENLINLKVELSFTDKV